MKKLLLLTLVVLIGAISLTGCVVKQVGPDAVNAPSFWVQVSSWTLFNLFVFGSIGFWIYITAWLLVLIIYCSWCSEEDWGIPIAFIIGGLILMWIVGAFNPFVLLFQFVFASPLTVIAIFVGYIVIGLVYVRIKLGLLSATLAKEYGKRLESFLKQKKVKGLQVPPEYQKDWEDICNQHWSPRKNLSSQPRIDDYKDRLIFWWAWWPLSMPRTIVREFIIKLFENLYELFKGYFEKVLLKSFAKFNAPEPPQDGQSKGGSLLL